MPLPDARAGVDRLLRVRVRRLRYLRGLLVRILHHFDIDIVGIEVHPRPRGYVPPRGTVAVRSALSELP